jgi:nucleotide-binding universal stress UspA family protein
MMRLHRHLLHAARDHFGVKEEPMKSFRRILMATDFTEASGPAWERAVELARENGAELFLAHVYEPPNAVQAEAVAPGVFEEWKTTLRANAAQKLQRIAGEAWKSGVLAHTLVLTGMPDEAIAEAAREHTIDLIVIGTHGRTGFARLFLGSVAARLIATAPCAVLTVRAAETAPNPVEEAVAAMHA